MQKEENTRSEEEFGERNAKGITSETFLISLGKKLLKGGPTRFRREDREAADTIS